MEYQNNNSKNIIVDNSFNVHFSITIKGLNFVCIVIVIAFSILHDLSTFGKMIKEKHNSELFHAYILNSFTNNDMIVTIK